MLNVSCKYTSSNPDFWIKDYYDGLVNKIDIFTETEIGREMTLPSESASLKVDYYNRLRNDFLNEISVIEKANFKQIQLNTQQIQSMLQNALRHADESVFEECMDEIKRSVICKAFCFLVNSTAENLVYLICTDFYVTEQEIFYLKYLFTFSLFLSMPSN